MAIVKGKWPTNKRDEFGSVGLTVKTICSFCDEFHEGHRDKGKEWFDKHMKQHHRKILRIQASTPSPRSKKTGKPTRSYRKGRNGD